MVWKNIINIDAVEFQDGSFGDAYKSKTSDFSQAMGAKKLGFHVEILLPKNFSCPYHFHHLEEELFLVLEGQALLRQCDQYREVVKGDLIHFANGPAGAHQFYNHTDAPFRFLALSTMDDFEICEYPDSGKIFAAKINKVFENEASVKYIKGEEDPRKSWPAEHMK